VEIPLALSNSFFKACVPEIVGSRSIFVSWLEQIELGKIITNEKMTWRSCEYQLLAQPSLLKAVNWSEDGVKGLGG
jgi:hypothetical protein